MIHVGALACHSSLCCSAKVIPDNGPAPSWVLDGVSLSWPWSSVVSSEPGLCVWVNGIWFAFCASSLSWATADVVAEWRWWFAELEAAVFSVGKSVLTGASWLDRGVNGANETTSCSTICADRQFLVQRALCASQTSWVQILASDCRVWAVSRKGSKRSSPSSLGSFDM